MKKVINCETVCVAAMARVDGVQPPMSSHEIEAHLAHCADCRREIEQLENLSRLLSSRKRSLRSENLWAGIENRLPAPASARETRPLSPSFILLGLLLVVYRLVEMIPDRGGPGRAFKLVPVLLAVAAFVYLRENPFKINAELRLEGE